MTIWDDDTRQHIEVESCHFTGPQATCTLIHRDWQLCYQVQNTLVNAAPGAGDWIKPDDVRGIETAKGSIWQTSVVTPNSQPVKLKVEVKCSTCDRKAYHWLETKSPKCQRCAKESKRGTLERRKRPREGKAA